MARAFALLAAAALLAAPALAQDAGFTYTRAINGDCLTASSLSESVFPASYYVSGEDTETYTNASTVRPCARRGADGL